MHACMLSIQYSSSSSYGCVSVLEMLAVFPSDLSLNQSEKIKIINTPSTARAESQSQSQTR